MDWGNWIEHDGKGCPCVGMWVQARWLHEDGTIHRTPSGSEDETFVAEGGGSWFMDPQFNPIIRYRIRKPRGMSILEEIVMNPERELEKV